MIAETSAVSVCVETLVKMAYVCNVLSWSVPYRGTRVDSMSARLRKQGQCVAWCAYTSYRPYQIILLWDRQRGTINDDLLLPAMHRCSDVTTLPCDVVTVSTPFTTRVFTRGPVRRRRSNEIYFNIVIGSIRCRRAATTVIRFLTAANTRRRRRTA